MSKLTDLVKKYFANKRQADVEKYTNAQTDGKSWEELTPMAKGNEIMNSIKSKKTNK